MDEDLITCRSCIYSDCLDKARREILYDEILYPGAKETEKEYYGYCHFNTPSIGKNGHSLWPKVYIDNEYCGEYSQVFKIKK